MAEPWMLSSESTFDDRRQYGWGMDALFSERIRPWYTMVGPWMLSCENALDHGYDHGWAMDALFSDRTRPL